METIDGSDVVVTRQNPEGGGRGHSLLERITLLLSRWDGLQLAVENQWGGRDSAQKFKHFSHEILDWFSQSKAPIHVEDLETLLHERMLFSFNTEIEDGSIEEVAEQLMIMHEEYFHGYH